jgi:16S rRNA (uracil1498-N3)-methyltransferase
VFVFNGNGVEYLGMVGEYYAQTRSLQVQIVAVSHQEPETQLYVHVLLAISKGERMEMAVQKLVELGVAHISPVLTQRSVVQFTEKRRNQRHQHWQQVAISACEQSGRCRVPTIDPIRSFNQVLNAEEITAEMRLVLDPQGAVSLRSLMPPLRNILLLIGPEGGLTAEEILAAQQSGFISIRLGPRILRTETAPLAVLAALQALWGDFG